MARRWKQAAPLLIAIAVVAAGCDGPQSALAPAGRDAERIARLFWVMLVGSVVVWAAVVLVAVYAIRSRRESLSHRTANLLIIGGGVALPAVVLTALLAYGMPVLSAVMTPAPDAALQIDVTAKQWWWRVRYLSDGAAVETANEIRVPLGKRIDVRLTSTDVIHSFWVPSIAGKMDAFPGRFTRLSIEPTRAGTFRGTCAEYCGASHAFMPLVIVVMPADDFRRWLQQQAQPAITPTAAASYGQSEFIANGCGACHSVRGTPADGQIGPDLTHLGSRLDTGRGVLRRDADALVKWISETDTIKPGVHMPAFRALPPDRVRAIAEYLMSLQ